MTKIFPENRYPITTVNIGAGYDIVTPEEALFDAVNKFAGYIGMDAECISLPLFRSIDKGVDDHKANYPMYKNLSMTDLEALTCIHAGILPNVVGNQEAKTRLEIIYDALGIGKEKLSFGLEEEFSFYGTQAHCMRLANIADNEMALFLPHDVPLLTNIYADLIHPSVKQNDFLFDANIEENLELILFSRNYYGAVRKNDGSIIHFKENNPQRYTNRGFKASEEVQRLAYGNRKGLAQALAMGKLFQSRKKNYPMEYRQVRNSVVMYLAGHMSRRPEKWAISEDVAQMLMMMLINSRNEGVRTEVLLDHNDHFKIADVDSLQDYSSERDVIETDPDSVYPNIQDLETANDAITDRLEELPLGRNFAYIAQDKLGKIRPLLKTYPDNVPLSRKQRRKLKKSVIKRIREYEVQDIFAPDGTFIGQPSNGHNTRRTLKFIRERYRPKLERDRTEFIELLKNRDRI